MKADNEEGINDFLVKCDFKFIPLTLTYTTTLECPLHVLSAVVADRK
jgi:hypothetical protein